jgi:hypothetical protein
MESYRRTRLPGLIDSNLLSDASIPLSIDDCIFWLDATQIDGLSDNDDLTTWEDLSGNGLDVSESTNKPKYKTSGINSLPSVQFGINASTQLASSASPTIQNFSLFIVCYQISYGAANPIMFQQDNTNVGIVCMHTNSNVLYYRNPLGNDQTITSVAIATKMIYLFQHDSEIHAWLNGSEDSTGGAAAVERSTTITIGNQEGSGNEYDGYIGEIIWYDRSLTNAEIVKINLYLNTKWDIY